MKVNVFPFLCIFFAVLVMRLPAQTPKDPPIPPDLQQLIQSEQARKERDRQDADARAETLNQLTKTESKSWGSIKISKETKERLKIADKDRTDYADFLSKDATGIFKLLSMPNCDRSAGIADPHDCQSQQLQVLRFGSGFSFRDKGQTGADGADLLLSNGRLGSRAIGVRTRMVDMGKTPITDVSAESQQMKDLIEFRPEVGIDDVKQLIRIRIRASWALPEGIAYASYQLHTKQTYALRTIAYGFRGRPLRSGPSDDVIVVFQIIRCDPDGSLTIIYRELSRGKAPTILL